MNNPLGVSPSKGNQGTTRGTEKILLNSVGIEPTTSGLDLPLLDKLPSTLDKNLHSSALPINSSHKSIVSNYYMATIVRAL